MRKEGRSPIGMTWLVASVACFVLPLVLTPATETNGWIISAGQEMILGMFVFSFPASILFALFAIVFSEMFPPYDLPVATYLLLWFGFFLTGYVQWFCVIPNLGKRQPFITLGLGTSEERKASKRKRRRRRGRRNRLHNAVIPILDEAGRTPLERVISDR